MKNILFVTWLVIAFSFDATTSRGQERVYTLDDTLRGSIGPAREWWDVTYYALYIDLEPKNKFLAGHVDIHYKVLKAGQVMQIDLQPPLVFEKAVQDDQVLSFEKKGKNAYMVKLSRPQLTSQSNTVRVYYSGHPHIAVNPPWDGGMQFVKDKLGNDFVATSCQGLGASIWWPNKDHSYDEPDSMTISVTVPQPLMDVSNGRLRERRDNSDSTSTFVWHVSNPINNYGVNINVADYTHFGDTLRGEGGVLDLDYYVLPYNLEKAKEQFKQVKLMLKAFEHWFGPYPFYADGYKLVETPYLGMEHQSSVTYGNGYQNGYRGRDLSGTGWGLKWDFIIIHESGHEWFANNITYRDIADMWIHESFTNYSETLFTEYYFGEEAGTDYNVGTRKGIQNDIPIIGTYGVNESGSGDMYPKGGNMLHTIRHSLKDDEKFRNILRGLNREFHLKTVTTAQIEKYISKEAGVNFSLVFDQYLRTVKVPVLEYYVKKRKLYYRWGNCVDGFNLRLHLKEPFNGINTLSPETKWKKLKTGKQGSVIDKAFLERMYYINVEDVSTSD